MNELSSDAPSMAVISGTETLDAPLDHPRDEGEDRTNLIINYLPQVMIITSLVQEISRTFLFSVDDGHRIILDVYHSWPYSLCQDHERQELWL